ncbi:MAG: hypothetical protein KC731_42640, partial [Myxococcales bacterium]|nr:hypothetical protein [Myxococcales bacterium]
MLRRFIDLRPGEGPVVLRTFAVLFTIIAGHAIMETTRDALFLEELPASRLPIVYIVLAVIGLVVPLYNSRYVRSFGRRNAAVFTLMAASMGTTLWHFRVPGQIAAYGLYVWSGLLGTVLVVQFWMFAGQLFTVAQGKRLFPGIASGGLLGALSGSLLATAALELTPEAGIPNLLLIAAGAFLLAALFLTSIDTDDVGTPFRAAGSDLQLDEGLSVLREHPYVRRIAAVVALGTITVLVTDYLFKLVAKSTVPTHELGSFFARYYAVLNAVGLVVQLFLAQRIVQRFGVVVALAVLPLLLLAGGGAMLALGGLTILVVLTKGADGTLRHSLHRVASELLYLPLPPQVRDPSKSLVDAVFVRGAQAATAGGILLLASVELANVKILSGLIVVLAGAWLVNVLRLKKGYVDLLREELARGSLDARLLQLEELDINSVESVMEALSSDNPRRVLGAMDLLVESQRARLIPALIFFHSDEAVLLRALEVLPRLDVQPWRIHAVRLTRSGSTAVRAAALRALGRACDADLVRPFISDASLEVRAHATFQLARCEGGDDPVEHPAMVALLEHGAQASIEERATIRRALLEAMRHDADERFMDLLLEIARADRSLAVIETVTAVLERVPDERFIDLLVEWLTIRDVRSSVQAALVKLGRPALVALEEAIAAPDRDLRLRRQIPLAIARFGTPRAATTLTEVMGRDPDGVIRYRALRGLNRLVTSYGVGVDQGVVEEAMTTNLHEYLRLLALLTPLVEGTDGPRRAASSGSMLVELLEDKMRQAL